MQEVCVQCGLLHLAERVQDVMVSRLRKLELPKMTSNPGLKFAIPNSSVAVKKFFKNSMRASPSNTEGLQAKSLAVTTK